MFNMQSGLHRGVFGKGRGWCYFALGKCWMGVLLSIMLNGGGAAPGDGCAHGGGAAPGDGRAHVGGAAIQKFFLM